MAVEHATTQDGGNVLGPHDFVGQTFYLTCNAMLAFTFFFFVQVCSSPVLRPSSVSSPSLEQDLTQCLRQRSHCMLPFEAQGGAYS